MVNPNQSIEKGNNKRNIKKFGDEAGNRRRSIKASS